MTIRERDLLRDVINNTVVTLGKTRHPPPKDPCETNKILWSDETKIEHVVLNSVSCVKGTRHNSSPALQGWYRSGAHWGQHQAVGMFSSSSNRQTDYGCGKADWSKVQRSK